MKHFIKALMYFGIAFIFVISTVWFSAWFTPKPKTNIVQIDITDREKGICSSMYKEGFKWGYGQFSIVVAEGRIRHQSDEEIKNTLLRMTSNNLENF